jgi:hypothetical protein
LFDYANPLFGDAMNERWTAEELKFQARIGEAVDRERDRYEARLRRPMTDVDLVRFQQWVARYEELAWEEFYRPLERIHGGKPC